jgi:hypothetical protein
MSNRELERELKYLMSQTNLPFAFRFGAKSFGETFSKFKSNKISEIKDVLEGKYRYSKYVKDSYTNLKRLFEIADELGLNEEEIRLKWAEISKNRKAQVELYKRKPTREGRDNKGVYVGSGGSYKGNTIRYPGKKRSKRTWKIFYQMFPRLAKEDGWDGNTSKKMQ